MPRKQHLYHYIYKTINLINEKYYIGMHSTSNLEDGYIGSGTRLWHSIRKYGKENFKCEILEFLPDRSCLKERERELVNTDLLKDSQCMNLKPGGEGGFINEEHKEKWVKAGPLKLKYLLETDLEYKKKHSEKISKIQCKIYEKGRIITAPNFKGRKHKEETKKLIGESNSIKQSGDGNSQYGSKWINNTIIDKKIKGDQLETYLLEGWITGRIKK